MNKSWLYLLVLLVITYASALPSCIGGEQACSDYCRLHIIGANGSRPKGGHCGGPIGLTCICDY